MWRLASSLRNFYNLGKTQRHLTSRALVLVAFAHVLIRVSGYSVWSRWIRPLRNPQVEESLSTPAVGVAVERAAKFIPRSTCLVQAMAVQLLCRQKGLRTEVRIGVMVDKDGTFMAHAWVEAADNEVIVGSMDNLDQYAAFPLLKGRRETDRLFRKWHWR